MVEGDGARAMLGRMDTRLAAFRDAEAGLRPVALEKSAHAAERLHRRSGREQFQGLLDRMGI